MGKSNKKRLKREKLGDIYEIPLPNGLNAYGRVFKESVGIYKNFYNSYDELPFDEEYLFFPGIYTYAKRTLNIVGNRPFDDNSDEAWGPKKCVVDGITLIGAIYYKGEIFECSYNECKDLEVVSAWDINQIVDTLMGDGKWLNSIRKPVNSSIKSNY